MSRKLLLFGLFVGLAALLTGFTAAWFTAKAELENDFTAGTVMIEAASVGMLYGIESYTHTGNIYAIDPVNGAEIKIYDNPNTYSPWWYPNALAYDRQNHRLYFTTGQNALWFYDFSSYNAPAALVNADPYNRFNNPNNVLGATFGGGYYWYVLNQSGKLYQVSFDGAGYVDTVTERTMTTQYSLGMGDIVIDYKDGIIYGSSGTGAAGTGKIFFTYNLSTGDFQAFPTGLRALQLAWGNDGVLYGHDVDDNTWYTVNPADGSRVKLDFVSINRYEDLASNWQNNWNPGDCDIVRFRITNTGSKKSYVKKELELLWSFDWEYMETNWKALCFSETYENLEELQAAVAAGDSVATVGLCDGMEEYWQDVGGVFYYRHVLEPGESVELCLKICLKGAETGNAYQGATMTITGRSRAVQSSNNASEHVWLMQNVDGWWSPVGPFAFELSVPDVTGSPGGGVSVPVNLTSNGSVAGVQFDLSFDETLLTYVGVAPGTLTPGFDVTANLVAPGVLRVVIFDQTLKLIDGGTGSVAILTFQVNAAAFTGQGCPLALSGVILSDDTFPMPQSITPVLIQHGWLEVF